VVVFCTDYASNAADATKINARKIGQARNATMTLRVFVVVFCMLAVSACRERGAAPRSATSASEQQTTWRKLGQWSGSGPAQTDSFTSDSGALRIRWKTTAHAGAPPPGSFLLTIHSSISGRPLQVAVDQHGPGENIAYVTEDPRVFFAKIESTGLDWTFSVEEGYSGPVVVSR
jgi:hypothetical protein